MKKVLVSLAIVVLGWIFLSTLSIVLSSLAG